MFQAQSFCCTIVPLTHILLHSFNQYYPVVQFNSILKQSFIPKKMLLQQHETEEGEEEEEQKEECV